MRLKLPKSWEDTFAFLVLNFGGIFRWYGLFHIFQKHYPDDCERIHLEKYIHLFMAIFFAIIIYGNMFQLITTDTSVGRFFFFSGSLLPDGCRYCSDCDRNLPPRSQHCKLSIEWIFKRDHHWWFAGYCIGYHNPHNYLAMVVHTVLAALYCNVFNLTFVVSIKGSLTLYTFYPIVDHI